MKMKVILIIQIMMNNYRKYSKRSTIALGIAILAIALNLLNLLVTILIK